MTVYLLNTIATPINFDDTVGATVKFTRTNIIEAKALLSLGFVSAVGHQGTAELLSRLFDMRITAERRAIYMKPGDIGIHFFLRSRIPEGKVLNAEELKSLEFWIIKSEVEK